MNRKELIEKAALVVGGALVGGAATYFATRGLLKKRYIEMADNEIGSMKAVFDKHIAKLESEKKEQEEKLEEDLTDPEKHPVYAATTIESEQEYEDILKKRREARKEYDAIVKSGGYSTIKKDDEWKGKEPERDKFYPYIITFDEFYEDNPEYSKTSITYYKEDDTLLDDAEGIIPNHIDIVGPEALDFFGWKSKDPLVVHVRNEKIETDFEVTLDEGSYAETILGEMKEEYDRKQRKKRLDE